MIGAFQSDPDVQKFNVKPMGLASETTYDVVSVDTGALGSANGSDLMADGVDLIGSPNTAAHILLIRARE